VFDTQGRADRRRRDREQQRAAANRRIGHDMAYWIVAAPMICWGIAALAVAVAVLWAWTYVPHENIARYLLGAALILCGVWAARNLISDTPSARVAARASGVTRNGWHPVGVAGLVLLAAAFVVWRTL
jgi:hypothetical protein